MTKNSTADIIEQCRYLPGVTVHESGAYTDILLASAEGSGKMRFFRPVFGITPALVSVAAPSWPAPQLSDSAPEARGPLIVNYCLRGRCELVLNDNRSVFLTAGHVSLTEKFACGEYVYPGRSYEGIELFIDTEAAQDGVELLREHFSVDISALRERYCPGGETFIAKMPLPDTLISRLRGGTDMGNAAEETARRTAVIDLLALLQYGSDAPRADRLTYFTRSQVEMAKQIEAVVSKDLARQHTAREFAERFSVSESSVKNYFRGVYGQSILQYAAHCRMQHAAELLASTTLPVIEIAGRVGYGNQSKFSAAFRKKFGLSPREYRRAHKLTEKQRSQP